MQHVAVKWITHKANTEKAQTAEGTKEARDAIRRRSPRERRKDVVPLESSQGSVREDLPAHRPRRHFLYQPSLYVTRV